MKRNTPLKRGKPLARSRIQKKARPNGFPERTRLAVRRRSGGRCEAGSKHCSGPAAHLHHRKLRRHKDHSVVNALHVCRACHEHIHANPGVAYLMGWLVHEWADPAQVPAKRGG